MRLLLVEDEHTQAEYIANGLQKEGFSVCCTPTAEEAFRLLQQDRFDLVLLDIMLPQMNGFTFLEHMQSLEFSIPIIVLTALNDTKHIVRGLNLGAIDFVSKPFNWEELVARIRVVERKLASSSSMIYNFGDLTIDLNARKVKKADQDIYLTQKEFQILDYLLRHANCIVSKAQILDAIWGFQFDPASNVVEVHINRLRQKLDEHAQKYIITHRGIGYEFRI